MEKPVRCGCGGEAQVYEIHFWGKCYVCECTECGMTTKPKDTEAEAVTAWNRAMSGVAKDINVPNKTAKVVNKQRDVNGNYWGKCGECGNLAFGTYCSKCGAKLDWSGNETNRTSN